MMRTMSSNWCSSVFSHNIYVLGLLFFVPANATAESYENGFPQRPLPPEREVVVYPPPINTFYTESQIPITANLILPSITFWSPPSLIVPRITSLSPANLILLSITFWSPANLILPSVTFQSPANLILPSIT